MRNFSWKVLELSESKKTGEIAEGGGFPESRPGSKGEDPCL